MKLDPINPISKKKNTKNDNYQQQSQYQQSKYMKFPLSATDNDDNNDYFEHITVNNDSPFYNSKGKLYYASTTDSSKFKENLTNQLNVVLGGLIPLYPSVLQHDFVQPKHIVDLRTNPSSVTKRLIKKPSNNLSNDIRSVFIQSPVYMSDESYTSYVNQNPNNEMFQHVMYNKPRKLVHDLNDYINKYFEDDQMSLKQNKI